MARPPSMLGSFIQGTLDAIDAHDAELGREVRAALRPESLETLAGARRISFLPLELDAEVTRCLYAVAGRERARAILRENLAATFAAPVLSSFIHMALRLRGREPGRLLEWCPKVWGQLYRDAGSMCFRQTGACEGCFEAEGLPPVVTEDPDYLDGVAAAISAVFDLLEIEGHAELKNVDPAAGRAIITASWEAEA